MAHMEYKLVDYSYGNEVEFERIHYSIKACEKVAKDYKLTNYVIFERRVEPWKINKHWKKN